MAKKQANNGAQLVGRLVDGCKMTHQEVADYIGVSKYLVTLWKQGKVFPNQQNYEKLVDMTERLGGNEKFFPRMAVYRLQMQDMERIKEEC